MFSYDLRPYFDREPSPMMRLHIVGRGTFDLRDLDDVVINLQSIEVLLPRDGANFREAVIHLANVLWVEVITTPE